MKLLKISGTEKKDQYVYELLVNALEMYMFGYFDEGEKIKDKIKNLTKCNINNATQELREVLEKAFDEQEMKDRNLNRELNLDLKNTIEDLG